MTEPRSDEDRLWEEALDLIMRLQADPANPVTLELIRTWRQRSETNEAAWAEIAEIHRMTGHLLSPPPAGSRPRLSRRALLLGGLVGLGGIAAATQAPRLLLEAEADFLSAKAEILNLPLQDGTRVTLGPDSALKLAYSNTRRGVELLGGMAYFEVAPDRVRPFMVRSGGVTATAMGTAFEIGTEDARTSVAVDHGRVRVESPLVPRGEELDAGGWIALDPSRATTDRGTREVGQVASWRNGLLVVERETIASAVARIGRWQPGSVVIADLELGNQQVSGVYDLENPLQALRAVVYPHGGKVREIGPWLTVVTKI